MKKKLVAFLLSAACAASFLTGCGEASEEEQIMEKIQAANTSAAMLEQYDNVAVSYALPDGQDYLVYLDEETFLFTMNDHSTTVLFTPREQCEAGMDGDVEYMDRYINPFDADLGELWRENALLLETTAKETVDSIKREAGVLHIQTRLDAADMTPEYVEILGFTLAEGEYYACEYKADEQSLRILSTEEYVMRADGSREDMGKVTIDVNVDRPEYIAQMEAKGAAVDAMPAGQVRVITCIVDPGLETERTVTKTVEKGSYVLFPEDLQGYEIFLDAEATQPLVSVESQGADTDCTVYLIKK